MNDLTILGAHVRALLLDLLRTPAVIVFSIIFPAMFYSIMALPYAKSGPQVANFVLCSYVGFAMVGVTLLQFGVGLAAERGRPWERFLRTLPVTVRARFAARIVVALIFGIAAAGFVSLAARMFSPLALSGAQWFALTAYAIAGALPFILMGMAIAYWVSPRAALPVTNIAYLLGSFVGGFWMPPQMLPAMAAAISPFTPTRQYGELLWSVVDKHAVLPAVITLTLYALVFAALAFLGYRRDEKARYA